MKIGLIAPPWNPLPPVKYGGSEAMVDGLARALVKQGHDVEMFALEGSTTPVPTQQIPRGTQPWPFSPVAHELGFVINAFEKMSHYDVVHDHTLLAPLYARAFPDVAMVTTNHGPFVGDLETLYNHVAPWCSVVAVSHAQASATHLPVDVVHHGVDTEFLTYGEGKGDDKGEYLLFLGRMSEIKGPHLAAQAARAAGKRLLMAAKMKEDAEFEFFEQHVKPLLGDNVEYIGEVGGDEKLNLLRNATALVNPITWPEPFGLVMAEALACGTPVIALEKGPVSEIVNDGVTGIVCNSTLDLADACRNVKDIDRKACRESATSYFSLDRMARDYVKVYEKAASTDRRIDTVIDLEARQIIKA